MGLRQKCFQLALFCMVISGFVLTGYAGSVFAADPETVSINMAVEFMDHAAAAFICNDQGWFEQAGLHVKSYESYNTGMALAAALARGDVQVAYLCLVPAVNAYINAGVPIKIVAGTHQYGYGLVVDDRKVKSVRDLEKKGIRLGCVREGGAVDVLLRKIIDTHDLDQDKVLKNVRRMPPAKQLLAVGTGQLEAAMLPEQWTTMAEAAGFRMLLTAQDVWPKMQGSVLAVRQDLMADHPDVVRKLVDLLVRANELIYKNPRNAAEIVCRQMKLSNASMGNKPLNSNISATITPDILERSMARLEYGIALDPESVQGVIDFMAELGYIRKKFAAEDILDLRFLKDASSQ